MQQRSLCLALCLAAPVMLSAPSTVHADLPEGFVYDDGAFVVRLTNNFESRNGRPVDVGYFIDVDARIWANNAPANIAPQSAFRVRLKQGRRELASFVCESIIATSPSYHLPEGAPSSMWIDHCNDGREARIQRSGDLALEVYFVNGGDDSETLVRTHHFAVQKFERTRGRGAPEADRYHVVYSSEATSALLHDSALRNYGVGTGSRNGDGRLLLVTWAAPTNRNGVEASGPGFDDDLALRCRVDGTLVPIAGNVRSRSVITYAYARSWGGGGRAETEQYAMDRVVLTLPLSTREVYNAVDIHAHPGQWICELRRSRETVRTFSFRVADGEVQPHPEEVAGNAHFQPGTHMVDIRYAAEPELETRLSASETANGPFFGIGWQTDEGRAMGAAVPTVGTTRLGARARRGRRGRRGGGRR